MRSERWCCLSEPAMLPHVRQQPSAAANRQQDRLEDQNFVTLAGAHYLLGWGSLFSHRCTACDGCGNAVRSNVTTDGHTHVMHGDIRLELHLRLIHKPHACKTHDQMLSHSSMARQRSSARHRHCSSALSHECTTPTESTLRTNEMKASSHRMPLPMHTRCTHIQTSSHCRQDAIWTHASQWLRNGVQRHHDRQGRSN